MMYAREVGLAHSTGEVAEQRRARGRGGDGGKGRGQGQCGPGQHVPDAELGKRIPRTGPHTFDRKRDKRVRFTALLHHATVDLLRWSFYPLQRRAAAGIDGVTWDQYETGVEGNLADLYGRVQRGAYRAKPSRRQ